MLNKKILLGAILSMAVCLSACSGGGTDVTGANSETSAENASVTASEGVQAEESEKSDDNGGEEDDLISPLTADPVSAAKVYLQKLSESESVKSAELRNTSIGQCSFEADKYYESPLAEEFGVSEDTMLVPVRVDYYIEYAENSEFKSEEKSEYFLVKLSENGFEVIDTFPYDPQDYYGEVKEILTDEDGEIRFYMVELDGGLGTVRCNNAVIFSNDWKEAGERVKIHGNGGIYGDPPRIDAIAVLSESELSDEE
ncbi:MAG: hypothetical protein K2J11_09020 [Oscillospiraceae bacterium]|nr:hypothetical protein [Oscillospiraceae bacterium]